MQLEPQALAPWLQRNIVDFEFSGEVQDHMRSIGLTIELREAASNDILQSLRFELLTPVVDMEEIADPALRAQLVAEEGQYSKIPFRVEQAFVRSGMDRRYFLRLVPLARKARGAAKGKNGKVPDFHDFLALQAQMARLRLDWRNGFSAVRCYHAEHPEACAHLSNPLYRPMPDVRPGDVLSRLPPQPSDTTNAVAEGRFDELFDLAFSDPA